MPVEELRSIRKVADENDLPIHLDGARIFNAAAAVGLEAAAWTRLAHTTMFCVSKGLGAPIGSLLCGPAEAMREARRLKILYGGAWRQAGIVAAAGLVALEEGPGRLHEDHARARRLAEGLAEMLPPGSVDLEQVATNMVFVQTEPLGLGALEVIERLATHGVGATFTGAVRMVTHVDIDDEGVGLALDAWRSVAADAAKED
jgi:threonine aldolase